MQEIWWSYWYFHVPNYLLAILIYTMLGRFLLSLILPPNSPNYIYRWFRRWTDWALAPVAVITPRAVSPLLLPPIAAFWLVIARLVFFVVMFQAGLVPRIVGGQG